MAGDPIYAFRVMRLPLLDAGGATIGRLDDIVLLPGHAAGSPGGRRPARVVGFVATSQRRRIFVNVGRVASLDSDGARLRSWDVDLNPFKPRSGEILIGRDVIDRRVGDETVSDIALRAVTDGKQSWWEPATVRLARRSTLRRRPSFRLVDAAELPALFAMQAGGEMAAEAARLRDMHPSDVANLVRSMPPARRKGIAAAMDDERLADLLEELPEAEQLRLIEELDIERLVGVLEEMEYDDLADLLAEMPGEQRTMVLAAMDEEDADVMRRLLAYAEGTAGALMTPEIIILGANSTVAEALAHIRDPEWLVSIAAQVFVVQPPFKPPTGTYLGVVHFQRLLREPPSMELGRCLEHEPTIDPLLSEREVAEQLASYNMLSMGVCDEAGRLLGAITVDDVLDRTLPRGWRQRRRVTPEVVDTGAGPRDAAQTRRTTGHASDSMIGGA
jgi:CBS domain-containing protein